MGAKANKDFLDLFDCLSSVDSLDANTLTVGCIYFLYRVLFCKGISPILLFSCNAVDANYVVYNFGGSW